MIWNISFIFCSLSILLEIGTVYCACPYKSVTKGERITKCKEVNILQRPVWLDTAGMRKGINHDRQHLGIILASGQTIRVRQINRAFTDNLTLRLLNDNSISERSVSFAKNWVEITTTAVSVPFIDTPYTDIEPMVEYEYLNNVRTLPVYNKGDDQRKFFDLWNSQKAEFALVQSKYVIILIPTASKTKLNSLNIDELLDYYESIFSFYNELVGLSFLPQRLTDKNTRDRYFIKADASGPGDAYYKQDCTAESTSSINRFWLGMSAEWGALHEIGHGYQGHFLGDKYFNVKEVWNNIYAASYQQMMKGQYEYKKEGLSELIKKSVPLNKWDHFEKLAFLIMMIEKAGINSFIHFNQQYRVKSNSANFVASDHHLLDMLSESFSVAGNQVDITPFVELVGGYISPNQRERNLLSQAKAIYPLNQLVHGEMLDKLLRGLKTLTAFSLVNVEELQASGIKGNVTLHLKIDDFSQIYGENLILMDGTRFVRQILIMQPDIMLKKLPIGVYILRLPTGKNKKYCQQATYLVVKAGDSQEDVVFVRKNASSLLNQKINFLGFMDLLFSTIEVNWDKKLMTVDVTRNEPHYIFNNKIYVQILMRDKQGVFCFNKTIMGTNVTISHDNVPFTIGDKIEIYHAEPSRMKLTPASEGVFAAESKTNVLQITAYGLKNEALNNDPQTALLHRLEESANILRNKYKMQVTDFTALNNVYFAIDSFSSPQREELMKKYDDYIPANNNAAPDDKQGNVFNFRFHGIGDWLFLTAQLDLVKKQFAIKYEGKIAHHYFKNTYAGLRYLDDSGKELLNLDIVGNKSMNAQSRTLPISGQGGEIIHLYHEEANGRLLIMNEMQQLRVADRGKVQSYCVTQTGLVRA